MLLLRPHSGLESQASLNSPSPAPAQGLEPSIHARRALDLPVPERPLSWAPSSGRWDPGQRRVSVAVVSYPAEAGPGARLCCRPRGGKASRPEAERCSLVSGAVPEGGGKRRCLLPRGDFKAPLPSSPRA